MTTNQESDTVAIRSIGDLLAANLVALRSNRGLSVRALSKRMEALGRPLLPSGISKAEHRDPERRRQITAEELCALAVALDVSPAVFFASPDPTEPVSIAPHRKASGAEVARWVRGEVALESVTRTGLESPRERISAASRGVQVAVARLQDALAETS